MEEFDESGINDSLEGAHILGLLSRCPCTEGYYFKLYRVEPNGRRSFLQDIKNYETWQDIETEIHKIVEANPWGLESRTGEYQIFIYQQGKPGMAKGVTPLTFNFSFPQAAQAAPPTPTIDYPGMIKAVGELAANLQNIPGFKAREGSNDTAKIMGEAFSAGIDVMKNAMPAQSGPSSTDRLLERLLEKLDSKTKEKNALEDLAEKMLLAKLSEQPEKFDPIAKMNELKELAALVFPGAGPAEPPSALNKIIETVGPAIPGLIDRIVKPIDNLISFQREKLAYMHNAPNRGPVPPPAREELKQPVSPSSAGELAPPSRQAQPISVTEEEDVNFGAAMSFLKKLKKMIEVGDKNFQNVLDGLRFAFGSEVVDQYADGAITRESLMDTLKKFDRFFDSGQADDYINAFFDWADAELKPLMYVCPGCGAEEELTAAEFNEDSHCGGCGEQLKPKSESAAVPGGQAAEAIAAENVAVKKSNGNGKGKGGLN